MITAASDGTRLRDFFDATYSKQHDLRPGSVIAFRTAIAALDRWHGSPVLVEELTDILVSRWLEAMTKSKAARPTAKSYRGHVLCVWRFAHALGNCPEPPQYVRAVKLQKRIPTAWTLEGVERILAAAQQQPGNVGPWKAADWWVALLLTIYDSGGRITPVMRLRVADCQLHDQTPGAVLPAEHGKTGADQWFALSAQTVTALRKIWSEREEVFGDWPSDRTRKPQRWPTLCKHYRQILKRAELPTGRRDLFHKLRRTTGTLVTAAAGLQAGADALRHSSPSITAAAYVDWRMVKLPSAVTYLPRPKLEVQS